MTDISKKITDLEASIARQRESAAYAEGSSYREEMSRLSRMERELHQLKKERDANAIT
ncbi:hypothetical protein PU634_04860 [Oceanimonas pelagia]|uniref:Uncharacterized protein n=1 Tax=Oceanimonas pelagia TaxID=3028314 RepID=A0AA50KRF5_9GAMM|nr:hypothetical protein [Oceanimonas pelagia]WMC11697.1 hypothetical protein PU634_04860 [Oceanimonas pelagia]